MEPEISNRMHEHADGRVLHNIEQVRSALGTLWQSETDLDELSRTLSSQDRKHQHDLVAHDHEMTALLRLGEKKKEPQEKRDIHRLRIISGSSAKRSAVEDALRGGDIEVTRMTDGMGDEDEKRSHELLQRLIQEHEKRMRSGSIPLPFRKHTPDLYTAYVAEEKARAVATTYPHDALFASDVAVLYGTDILEKPRDETEARAMLENIAGGKVRISVGSALITSVRSGETILMREGVVLSIQLKQYSPEDVARYLHDRREYRSIAGAIDYAAPESQQLIASDSVQIEALAIQGERTSKRTISLDPSLLPEMRDYFVGAPREMIQAMVQQAKDWS